MGLFSEIMGHCTGTNKTSSNESFHHVDGWQLYLHLPDHDGWHDVHPSHPSPHGGSAE